MTRRCLFDVWKVSERKITKEMLYLNNNLKVTVVSLIVEVPRGYCYACPRYEYQVGVSKTVAEIMDGDDEQEI